MINSHGPSAPKQNPYQGLPPEGTPVFSPQLLDSLQVSYLGLRGVTLNWAETAAHDVDGVRAVLQGSNLGDSAIGRDTVAFAASSLHRLAKLLHALHMLDKLISSTPIMPLSSRDYDAHVRDPLAALKTLALDHSVSGCGSHCAAGDGGPRDASLASLLLAHGQEIDHLLAAIPQHP